MALREKAMAESFDPMFSLDRGCFEGRIEIAAENVTRDTSTGSL